MGPMVLAVVSTLLLITGGPGAAGNPPLPPTIQEPGMDGQILNPADVHMETAPFSDPDPGEVHAATDWEIWQVSPSERVWAALGVTGLEAIHAHLGDGSFEGTLAGAGALLENTAYRLRVRHKDSSGDPASEWSPWSERSFQTGAAQEWFALEIEDVAVAPAPRWLDAASGAPMDLPGGATPPRMILETAQGALLYEVQGADGVDTVINPPGLPSHEPVRLRILGGSTIFQLPASTLELYEHGCERYELLLPSLGLAPTWEFHFWISSEGVPFTAQPGSTTPDFSSAALLPDPPWVAEQAGFVVEHVVGGLQLAVDIAFVPNPGSAPGDPLFYVSELYGTIRVVTNDGTLGTYASGLIDFSPTGLFPGSGEQGLTGLAVDPLTGDLFASMLYDGGGVFTSVHYPKVVRFQSLDGGLTAASQTTILDFNGESQGQSHQISNLQVTPDGKLLVHMGDGFDSSTALDPNSYRGKILRSNLDGSAPSDNPFYDAGDGINARDYTWALGVRNPFGGDLRDVDGLLYEVENGPSIDRLSRITPGLNLDWAGSDSHMFQDAQYNWNPATGPVDLAFAQASAFGGGGFPDDKDGHAFVSLSGATFATGPQSETKRIQEFTLDAAGQVLGSPLALVRYAGNGKSTVSGLAFGPDGLYFLTLYADPPSSTPVDVGASVLRVRWVGIEDCNGNGQPDVCDVALGLSPDCDGDGVPDECQLPLEVSRPGTPPNPEALLGGVSGGPAIGSTWDPVVDHTAFAPTATVDVLAVSLAPANLPSAAGTVLCDPGPPLFLFQTAPSTPFQVPVPSDCGAVGLTVCAQAAAVTASGGVLLTNALDVTLGY